MSTNVALVLRYRIRLKNDKQLLSSLWHARKRRGPPYVYGNDSYDMEEIVMPLHEYLNHPVAMDLIQNGATFQVAGLTNNSNIRDAHELRQCVPGYFSVNGIGKEQDKAAVDSHRKAAAATAFGKFKDEIIPVKIKIVVPKTGEATPVTISVDDGIRSGTAFADLAKLKAVFKKDGTTTAGDRFSEALGLLIVLDTREVWTSIRACLFTCLCEHSPTVFLEIIQRIGCMVKDDEGKLQQKPGCGGFGKGNYVELFKSIEEYVKTLEARSTDEPTGSA
ncbi:protein-tyrosine sulfotransferase-like protein [Tanacetum coccineum]